MLRQLVARRIRTIIASHGHYPALLGSVGACELSVQGCQEPATSLALCSRTYRSLAAQSVHNQQLHFLPPRPTARLEIWRQFAATAAVAPRAFICLASVTSKKKSTAAERVGTKGEKPKSSVAPKHKSSVAPKHKAVRAKNAGTSRTSGTARGRAAAERRRVVKEARAAAKAQAADSIAKAKAREKARAEKLRAEIETRVSVVRAKAEEAKAHAISKIKAKAEKKLEKEKAKAAERVARLEAKVGGRIKRAPNARTLYLLEQMKVNPKLSMSEASQCFKVLPQVEKQKYVDQAAAAKAELRQAREKLTAERAARRVVPAFMFFVVEQRPAVLAANPGISVPDAARRLGEMWRGLTAVQRQKYIDMSDADRRAKGLIATPAAAAAPAPHAAASALA